MALASTRFLSTIDNDIEIVGNTDSALIYDRTIGGIRWRDIQGWWQNTQKIPSETEAKKSLYARLRRSLPDNSPGQQNLFTLYHEILGSAVYDFPALLAEVWLHWDHKTVRERGREAPLRFRMDVLLLLPHGQRIVLEVDGSQHCTSHGGQRPDNTKYAAMVAGDRDLKLSGYEVFRFGSDELADRHHARPLLQQFRLRSDAARAVERGDAGCLRRRLTPSCECCTARRPPRRPTPGRLEINPH